MSRGADATPEAVRPMPYGSIAPFDILARSSPLCQASMAAESCLGLHITPRVMNQNHPRARIDYLEVLPRPGTVTTAATTVTGSD